MTGNHGEQFQLGDRQKRLSVGCGRGQGGSQAFGEKGHFQQAWGEGRRDGLCAKGTVFLL